MSRVAITLCSGLPAACRLAVHEIWLSDTSCGSHPPLSLQIVLGCTGSVTSARTLIVDRWTMSTASRAVGTPVQVACIAAHVGTGSGLATGIGEGLGVGEGGG